MGTVYVTLWERGCITVLKELHLVSGLGAWDLRSSPLLPGMAEVEDGLVESRGEDP